MTESKGIVICVLIGFMVFATCPRAQELKEPVTDQSFSTEKEKKIDQLDIMAIPDVFAFLRSDELLDDEEYLNKAIFKAFNHRSEQAVQFALGYVRSAQIQKNLTGHQDFYIAKRALQIFPDQSLESLLDLYSSGGPKVRKNVIEVLGQMTGGQSIPAVLIDALDDMSFCEEEHPESIGEPLRICDAAYNQMVIRYKIKNVVRVIGSIHSIDMRNHYIKILKDML